jgi:serine/threonine protein kinase
MAVASSVESLCNLLSRSKLLKPPQVQTVYKQWRRKENRGAAGETDRFAKWLVADHYLTPYQAQQLLVGQADHFFLNHYKLLDLIGKGRMAGIFKGVHSLGEIVAVKLMPPSKSADPKILARFQREAKMAVRLKHAYTVRTYHLGNAGGRHYIVMEYLEGETLEEVLKRRKKLPIAEGVRLVYQALLGMQHIHEQGLIHRDVKPGNLMLTPPRPPGAPDNTLHAVVKILDIGMGRILFDESIKGDSESGMQLTTEGMMLGTPEYMAPEQARNPHGADIRADIYSVGCVLYHCLTGQPPFVDKADFEVVMRHLSEPPRPLRALEPSVPDALQAVMNVLLAKAPAQRYATPEQAARALQPFLPGPEPIPPSERWYYSRGGLSIGPVPTPQLAQLAAAGKIGPNDLLWMDGDNPDLAIPAKAAIDFTGLANKDQRHTQHVASIAPTPTAIPVATPARSAIPVATAVAAPYPTATALLESGFDPETGQIFDAAKFKVWQRDQQAKRDQASAAAPTTGELFQKARVHLDRWLDFDRNRRPIMAGDMEFIRQDPDIQRFMHYYARYGQEMLHKLWQHLQFMVENRRKYYCALG